MEQRTAVELKRLNPSVKVLGIRNDQVVSPLWDSARARMLDPSSSHFWLHDASGNPIVGAWTDSPQRNQTMASGAVTKYFLNWSEPVARQWWADVHVGSALAEQNLDGAYFDCACESVLPVDELVRKHADAAPAIRQVLYRAVQAGKWLAPYKPDGPTAACDKPQVRRSYCAVPMRYFIELGKNTSAGAQNSTMLMLHDFRDKEQTVETSVAAFLIARGASALLRLSSCVGCAYDKPTPPWSPLFERSVGRPLGAATETRTGVFERQYQKANVTLDCGTFTASIAG